MNKPFTVEDFERLARKLVEPKPRELEVNQKMYNLLVQEIGCEPSNVKINNHLPDNQALCYDKDSEPFEYNFNPIRKFD